MRLLEREHPLDVLAERARRSAAGDGCVVLVAGEAGIGKTVLLRAFVEQAGAQPLWGMCDSLSTPRPLGPLRDVADELGPSVAALLRGTAAQHEIFAAVLDALRSRPRVFGAHREAVAFYEAALSHVGGESAPRRAVAAAPAAAGR